MHCNYNSNYKYNQNSEIMREIRYRGIGIAERKWVFGSLWFDTRDGVTLIWSEELKYWVRVDPATVGQYTGLKDKNGREIYVGDILKSERDDRLYVVKFWIGMFYASVDECNKGIFGGFPLHALTENEESGYECDIIGNIHDDPELLKTE